MQPNGNTATACEICGSTRGLDRHHILHRKMGGSKDPVVHDHANLISSCRSCHRNLHEGPWRLERLSEGIRIVDQRSGEQVMRRLSSAAVEAASLFRGLALIEASFVQVIPSQHILDRIGALPRSLLAGKEGALLAHRP